MESRILKHKGSVIKPLIICGGHVFVDDKYLYVRESDDAVLHLHLNDVECIDDIVDKCVKSEVIRILSSLNRYDISFSNAVCEIESLIQKEINKVINDIYK